MWITLGEGKKTTSVRALLDTGNTIAEETAVTDELHTYLGVGFKEIGGKPIGTANKEGPKLQKHGVSNPIPMRIEGIKGKFLVQPAVVPGLSDKFNIGSGFLNSIGKQIPVRIEFHEGKAKLQVGKMETEMIRCMGNQEETRNVDQKDHGKCQKSQDDQDHTKGISTDLKETSTRGRSKLAEKPSKRRREGGPLRRQQLYAERPLDKGTEILVESDGHNQMETIEALYRWSTKENRVAIMNPISVDIKVLKNSSLGFYSQASVDKEMETEQTQSYLEKINSMTEESRNQIVEDLGLNKNQVLNANPEIKKKAIALVKEFADIFGEKGKKEVGITDLVEFDIELKEGAKPVRQKVRPLNPHQRESLKKQVETWKREDIIEESISPWASPLVPAKKAGGAPGEIRWAIDYRALNSVTVKDSYPIPNIDEVLERLAGSKYYSALDAAAAYHTIPVAKKTRPLLAFITPMGLYQFARMPFGPSNSGAVYARFVEMLLQKIRSPYIVAYIDDILVFTADLENHLTQLRSLFEIHRISGVKLRPKKTKLFTEKTNYLGFEVSTNGISMKRSYVEKILDWPVPKTVKELALHHIITRL